MPRQSFSSQHDLDLFSSHTRRSNAPSADFDARRQNGDYEKWLSTGEGAYYAFQKVLNDIYYDDRELRPIITTILREAWEAKSGEKNDSLEFVYAMLLESLLNHAYSLEDTRKVAHTITRSYYRQRSERRVLGGGRR